MKTRITNHNNEYAKTLKMYAPKTVVEGVLVSFMIRVYGEEVLNDSEKCNQRFLEEWQTLYQNKIIPQKPPKKGIKK